MIALAIVLFLAGYLLIYTALRGKDQGFNPFAVIGEAWT